MQLALLQATIETLEWSLISGKPVEEAQLTTAILASHVVNSQYKHVLASNTVRSFLGTDLLALDEESTTTISDLENSLDVAAYISCRIKLHFEESTAFQHEQ